MARSKTKRSKFVAHADAGKVSALLLVPDDPIAVLVLGHGAGAGMEHANMQGIAEALAVQGIATMRYQFPYMERGGGRDRQEVTLSTIHNAVSHTIKKLPEVPVLAGGHSFGGRMTTIAQAEGPIGEVQGLICCSFPLHAPGRVSDHRIAHFADIKVPVLFLCGDRDTMMTYDLFEPAIAKMKHSRRKLATLHKIHTANHGYKVLKRTRTSPEPVFDEMARVARGWLDKKVL
ncbi:MAG: alpha/beta family hydrolase [Planctomycetota bacterium]